MMHALSLLCINQPSQLEVPIVTISKNTIGAKFKKRVTWPWPRPFYGWFVIRKL